MLILLIILLIATLLSLKLVRIGLHGKRIDDHVLCASCEFDLTGRNPDNTRCPECGADVTAPRATVIGHRRRIPSLIVLGLTTLLIAVAALAIIGRRAYASFNPNQFKPTWWLARDTSSAPAVRDAALLELTMRAMAGRLSQERINALADRAIGIQVNPPQVWSPMWGYFVEESRRAGKLGDERWEKYAYWAPNLQLRVRQRVPQGGMLPYHIAQGPARVGPNCRLVVRYGTPTVIVSGQTIQKTPPNDRTSSATSITATGGAATGGAVSLPQSLPPGTHKVRFSQELGVYGSWDEGAKRVATRTIDLDAEFEILPESQPIVKVVDQPELAEAVKKSIAVTNWWEAGDGQAPPRVNMQVNVSNPPIGLGFQVFVRTGGEEYRSGRIAVGGTGNWSTWLIAETKGQRPSHVDVIFRCDPDAAAGTLDTYEIWNGEISLPDVKIEPKRPPGR